MTEQDEREEAVFEAAVQLPAAERAEYLDKTCAREPELRRRVEGLLGALGRGSEFLKEPAVTSPPRTVSSLLSAGEQTGDIIGRYKLLQRIGEGGCGVVYMAEQEEPVHRRVALKIIKAGMDSKGVIARFEAERQALAMMDHPNIAKFFDAGVTATGRPYFVMELVRGSKITEYCDQNDLDTSVRLDLFMQVCRAVQHAHQKGIIHRDLKPSNILITLHDGVPVPKVIDFGIAKATQGRLTDQTMFTAFEQFIGTPAYMSPEQAELSGLDIDTRSDIYSLGVLLYELMTGKTPFDAKELVAAGLDKMRQTIREEEPVRPSTCLSTMVGGELATAAKRRSSDPPRLIHLLKGDLDWIVMKCLEKDRTRRYETANGLAMDIRRHLSSEPVVARPPSAIYRFQKLIRRNKLTVAAATTVAATLLLGMSVSTWQAALSRRQERIANANLYSANMRLAQYAWAQNSAGQVRELLQETEAYPLRGFEWFYWQRQTHLQLMTLQGHRTPVLAVAVSPDDQWIVTGSQDGTAILWETTSGNPLRTLAGHTGAVSSVAFSPNGQRIATASWDHTARVWETASGKLLFTLQGHTGKVFSVSFSPNGQQIVTGSQDYTAKVWDSSTSAEQFTLRGHTNWVWSAGFSGNGRRIVTGSQDRTAIVWDAAAGEKLLTYTNHSGSIQSVAWSPVDQRVATAGQDLMVRIWDPGTGRELTAPLTGHIGPIHSVAFSRNGQRLITGSFDQTARAWDSTNGTNLLILRGHGSPISSVVFSADGQRMVTGGGYVDISPLDRNVYFGPGDNTAKIWGASIDEGPLTLRGHVHRVVAVAFSPDSQRIITGSMDKTAIVWDAASSKPLLHLKGHDDTVRRVAFSPDGQRIVTGSFDGTARVWSASGEKLFEISGHTNKIFAVAFSPDGQRIITGSGDMTARVWSALDGKELGRLEGHSDFIYSVAFSPNGRLIATGNNDRTAAIWETATRKRLREFKGHDLSVAVAFSPDGKRIVTSSRQGTAIIWDVFTGEELLILKGHTVGICWVAFSPDGKRIVTGSWDRTAKVWQAASEEQVVRWRTEEQTAHY